MLVDPKRSFGPFLGLDLMFIVLALLTVAMLFDTSAASAESAASASRPLFAGLLSIAGVMILSIAAVWLSKIDQRMNDEFTYKAVALGAVVAVTVTLLFYLVFELLPMVEWGMGSLHTDRLIAVLLGSWAMGYAIFRIRGTAA
ncbi:hypothetical protein [Aurantiacibacter sediminis]|uniref:Uncharacterized protein n=1 Tax=Aurantiacibacter sediminis TaxID=2793064 RepID=A0ABS0N3W5_9SPHN|nr:hypothetical protein [Aurantiacibacter sediminis]MBH5322663.1 hypothetical protein [Aurantiacibacter sediminis]